MELASAEREDAVYVRERWLELSELLHIVVNWINEKLEENG